MKTKSLLITCLLFTFFISSCKKGSDDEINSLKGSIKVKYEITPTSSFTKDPTGLFDNNIIYVNSTMNVESVIASGKSWTKEIVIKNPKKGEPVMFDAMLALEGLNGTAYGKIFVDGILKAEVTQKGTNVGGITLVGLVVYWTI